MSKRPSNLQQRQHDPASGVWLARCKVAVGERDEAERMLNDAVQRPRQAALQAELSRLHLERGELEGSDTSSRCPGAR